MASHKSDIDCLYKKNCDSLENASKHCIPSNKIDYYKEHIVPGFNEHVKELHTIARHEYIAWRSAGNPRFGGICLSMNQSRLRFKSALKFCQHNENQMRADSLARSMMNNVLYCIVLYCIMRPYTDGPIGPLSYRHSSGVVRNPHSTLAE